MPFTRDQFLAVFVAYNEAVWPAQVWAYLLGLLMAALIIWPSAQPSRLVAAGLAAMWLWTGVAYHGMNFSTIGNGAWGFAALTSAKRTLKPKTPAGWFLHGRPKESKIRRRESSKGLQSYIRPVCAGMSSCWP